MGYTEAIIARVRLQNWEPPPGVEAAPGWVPHIPAQYHYTGLVWTQVQQNLAARTVITCGGYEWTWGRVFVDWKMGRLRGLGVGQIGRLGIRYPYVGTRGHKVIARSIFF